MKRSRLTCYLGLVSLVLLITSVIMISFIQSQIKTVFIIFGAIISIVLIIPGIFFARYEVYGMLTSTFGLQWRYSPLGKFYNIGSGLMTILISMFLLSVLFMVPSVSIT